LASNITIAGAENPAMATGSRSGTDQIHLAHAPERCRTGADVTAVARATAADAAVAMQAPVFLGRIRALWIEAVAWPPPVTEL
jgi:hypothetical protein